MLSAGNAVRSVQRCSLHHWWPASSACHLICNSDCILYMVSDFSTRLVYCWSFSLLSGFISALI